MTKTLRKLVQHYISKLKKSPSQPLLLSTNGLLGGCRHPKTPSLGAASHESHHSSDEGAATLSDVDRFLFENFKSLYEDDENEEHIKEIEDRNKEEKSSGYTFDSPKLIDPLPNLRGSHRFFVAPGSSGSLMEEARLSATSFEDSASTSTTTTSTCNRSTRMSDNHGKRTLNPEDFIAVLKYSPSPYEEFRNSMQEMIEARLQYNGKVGWDFMEELLFSYLNLNDKKSYKYVLSAFVDLIVVLRDNSGRIPERSRSCGKVRENGEISRKSC